MRTLDEVSLIRVSEIVASFDRGSAQDQTRSSDRRCAHTQPLFEKNDLVDTRMGAIGDGKKLERDFGFSPQGLLELNDLTKRFDRERHVELARGPLIGLQDLVAEYLDRYLAKDDDVRCGVWSRSLSKRQIRCK